jgi:hypothetical protein
MGSLIARKLIKWSLKSEILVPVEMLVSLSELFIIHMIMEWVGVALYSGCFRDQRYISVANYCIKVTKARLVSVQIG